MADNDNELMDSGVDPDAGVEIDLEPVAEKPQLVHSWTRINTFQTCPMLYKLVYLLKRKGFVNPIMVIGRVAHQAIGEYNNHCLKNKVESDFLKWKDFGYKALTESNLDPELNAEALRLVEQYAQSHIVSQESTVGAEEEIAVNKNWEQVDWLSPDVWLRVILDFLQIQGNICKITDYKTGWSMKADPFQLKIYALVIKKLYPQVTDFQIEIDYIRHEWQKMFTLTDEDIEEIERAVLSKIAKIESEEKFEPSIGVQCSYCPVWFACPAMKIGDVRKYVVPSKQDEAVALALEYEKYSRLASEVKKILKEYCDVEGDLIAGGRQYGFRVSNKFEFDIKDLYVALDEIGIDLLDYLTLDYRKFKALLHNANVLKVAKSIGEKKVSVTFSAKKADGKEDSE